MRRLLVIGVLAGCSTQPKSPGAEGARAAYTARAGKIAAFEAAVASAPAGADRKAVIDRATRDAGGHDCGQLTGKPGNVHPEEPEGLLLDGRRIGWGVYQAVDGNAWHPAIQVAWRAPLALELCFLLE
jgi:hypothetical protein